MATQAANQPELQSSWMTLLTRATSQEKGPQSHSGNIVIACPSISAESRMMRAVSRVGSTVVPQKGPWIGESEMGEFVEAIVACIDNHDLRSLVFCTHYDAPVPKDGLSYQHYAPGMSAEDRSVETGLLSRIVASQSRLANVKRLLSDQAGAIMRHPKITERILRGQFETLSLLQLADPRQVVYWDAALSDYRPLFPQSMLSA